MFADKEVDAIAKCTECLKELDDAAKVRVLQYIISRYNLTPATNSLASSTQTTFRENESTAIKMLAGSTDKGDEGQFEGVNHPNLKDVALKNLPKSEVEWILIYAFYASEFGIKEFTRYDINSQYELSKRKSENTTKNLSSNMNAVIKRGWMKSLDDDEYILENSGKIYALQVLQGNSTAKPKRMVSNGKNLRKKQDG